MIMMVVIVVLYFITTHMDPVIDFPNHTQRYDEEYFRKVKVYHFTSFIMWAMAMILLLILLAAWVVFMLWSYQIHKFAKDTGYRGAKKRSATAIWSWFVPIVNLFLPAVVLAEAYHGSRGLYLLAGTGQGKSDGDTSLVWGWWMLRIATRAALYFFFVFMDSNEMSGLFALIMVSTYLLSNAFAIFTTRRINRWHEAFISLTNAGQSKVKVLPRL